MGASDGGLVIAYVKIADPFDWERHEADIEAAARGSKA
jgi:hypothetical protein